MYQVSVQMIVLILATTHCSESMDFSTCTTPAQSSRRTRLKTHRYRHWTINGDSSGMSRNPFDEASYKLQEPYFADTFGYTLLCGSVGEIANVPDNGHQFSFKTMGNKSNQTPILFHLHWEFGVSNMAHVLALWTGLCSAFTRASHSVSIGMRFSN